MSNPIRVKVNDSRTFEPTQWTKAVRIFLESVESWDSTMLDNLPELLFEFGETGTHSAGIRLQLRGTRFVTWAYKVDAASKGYDGKSSLFVQSDRNSVLIELGHFIKDDTLEAFAIADLHGGRLHLAKCVDGGVDISSCGTIAADREAAISSAEPIVGRYVTANMMSPCTPQRST